MCPQQTQFTGQTFFFHMTLWGMAGAEKHTNMLLTVVNVASHFKEAKPLTSKDTAEVAGAFQKIYKHGPLKWPELLRWTRDTNSFTNIQCGWGDIHQDQAIMERFYRTLVECLFEHQHASKMHLPEDQRSF